MEPIQIYSLIQPAVQKEIDDKISAYANQAKFNVAQIPAHTHNGVDSQRIDYSDLEGTPNSINSVMYADSQSITTSDKITLNHSLYSNSVTNDISAYTMTVKTAGYYYIEATIGWDNPGANIPHRAYLKKNTTTIAMDIVSVGAVGLIMYNHISILTYLNAGDYISLIGTIDSGGAKSTTDTLQATKLSIFKI